MTEDSATPPLSASTYVRRMSVACMVVVVVVSATAMVAGRSRHAAADGLSVGPGDVFRAEASVAHSRWDNIISDHPFRRPTVAQPGAGVQVLECVGAGAATLPEPAAFFSTYVATSTPVVLRGAFTGAPALQHWASSEYMVDRIGDMVVTVEMTEDSPYGWGDNSWREEAMPCVACCTMRCVVASATHLTLCSLRVRGTPRLRYKFFRYAVDHARSHETPADQSPRNSSAFVNANLPRALASDVPLLSSWFPCAHTEQRVTQMRLQEGVGQRTSRVVARRWDTVLSVAIGRVTVRLVDPLLGAEMYEDVTRHDKTSPVLLTTPDVASFPKFASIQDQVMTVSLGPGDVLYIPAYWYVSHAVYDTVACVPLARLG